MASVMVGSTGKFMSATHMGMGVKARRGQVGRAAAEPHAIERGGVMSAAVKNRGEVVRHKRSPLVPRRDGSNESNYES